jgi:subfamily B ATP-binding cassette protein MsbA
LKKQFISDELKWAFSFLKPYVWALFGITVFTFGKNYAFALLPSVGTSFLFELITPENINLLYRYFFIALGLILIRAFFSFLAGYSIRIINHSAIKRIRDQFFTHLMTMDLKFFHENKTGDIIAIGINDIERVRLGFYQGLITFMSNIMMLIIIFTKLFLLNWKLSVASLAVVPLLYWIIRVVGGKMRKNSRKLRKNLSDLSVNLHETLTGIDVVKSFAQEEIEIEQFKKNTKRYKRTFLKLSLHQRLLGPLNEIIIYYIAMLLLGIGSYFILRNMWDVKQLMEYLLLLGLMTKPIKYIPSFIAKFKVVTASIERIHKVLLIKPKVIERANPISRKIDGKVEFKNVFFSYTPGVQVLQKVSFKVHKGETVALVGPSGAGKSTITNLIPRFYDTDQGEVLIDGNDVKDYSLKSLRSQIGLVLQEVTLFNTSILENIRYSRIDSSDEEIISAAKKAYAYDFIMEFTDKFETVVGEKGVKLSGGQKQRIAIARTILMDPRILIMDEATSSLDSESEQYIRKAVRNLMKGRTSIIIAHRLSTVSHAKKIVVIDKGIISDVGSHEELLDHCELYKKIYELQYFR